MSSIKKYKGPLLVLASQFFAVLMHGIAKFLETDTNKIQPLQVLHIRMLMTTIISSVYLYTRQPQEFPLGTKSVRPLLILRAVGGIGSAIGFYYSMNYLTLANATILNFIAPVGASIMIGFLNQRKLRVIEYFALAALFVGVTLITKPTFLVEAFTEDMSTASLHLQLEERKKLSKGIAFAILGAFSGTFSYTAIEFIGLRAHPLTITNAFSTSLLLFSTICFIVVPGMTYRFDLEWAQWFLLFLFGCFGTLMEYLMTAGLAVEKSGPAIHMVYSQVVLALLADAVVWHAIPDLFSFSGALLVVSGLVSSVVVNKEKKQEKGIAYDLDVEETM